MVFYTDQMTFDKVQKTFTAKLKDLGVNHVPSQFELVSNFTGLIREFRVSMKRYDRDGYVIEVFYTCTEPDHFVAIFSS